ncbi:MAG: acetylxylan esterase [Candidatus Dormibacteraceae bacterium]
MTPPDPAEFESYWRSVDQELAATPARPTIELLPVRSSDDYRVYTVRLTSIGPYRLFGYLSVPKGDGPFPALLETPRPGSVNYPPDHNDRLRYVAFAIMHRGQRHADSPFVAPYPGLFTLGVEDAGSYIYRSIVADCLRGAEFLLGRPEIDRQRVAVVGDDLALLTAARRPGFSTIRYENPMLYRALEGRRLTGEYPMEEFNDVLRLHPDWEPRVAHTLGLFDPLHHAGAIGAHTIVSVGEEGTSSGPSFLAPLLETLGGSVERYPLTFEGGTDHDRLDALLADRLGVPAMSRFLREVG